MTNRLNVLIYTPLKECDDMILSCGNEAGMQSQSGPPGPKTSAKWKIDRSISIVALKMDSSHTTSDEYCGPGLSTLFWERGNSSELSEIFVFVQDQY
jgi:hypothetical protein